MNFASLTFLGFYLVVFTLYWGIPAASWRHDVRKMLLLVASYYFYMNWDWRFSFLILASTIVDYGAGRIIAASEDPVFRRRALLVSLGMNLGFLGFFKYANFFIDSALELAHLLGVPVTEVELNIILPVGISFYTFQTLSYTVDVYRRHIPPARGFLDFALFVAFFPQLVAGPIVRAATFLPQLDSERLWEGWRLRQGLWLVSLGLTKKICFADHLAKLADPVFNQPGAYGFVETWLGVLAFAGQIYCDFSAYSDIAIGVASMLGYDLPENFRHPYLAQDIRDFWRRWHISLSTWLRDYLYIPLGGNRDGGWRTGRNMMITMVLGGLWHGAAWNFVAWGFYQGLLLSWARRAASQRSMWSAEVAVAWPLVLLRWGVTLALVCVGWVLFRADSTSDILRLLSAMLGWHGLGDIDFFHGRYALLLVPLALGHLAALWQEKHGGSLAEGPVWLRAAVVAGSWSLTLAFWDQSENFIYFQF
ncbi:MAG: hypothetical protein H7831_02745 [Magnetococcus sp. WYHC-3]